MTTIFQGLQVDDRFEFDHGKLSSWAGAVGPWIKMSARKYRSADSTPDTSLIYHVGSINVRVIKLSDAR